MASSYITLGETELEWNNTPLDTWNSFDFRMNKVCLDYDIVMI
jgi:hypothetical protein